MLNQSIPGKQAQQPTREKSASQQRHPSMTLTLTLTNIAGTILVKHDGSKKKTVSALCSNLFMSMDSSEKSRG
jgi:hypothetical protein